MAREAESWMTNEKFMNEAETLTAGEASVEVKKYADKQIYMAENRTESATIMTSKDFFRYAEKDTAMEADQQIEKYASRQIVLQQAKAGLLIAGNESEEN